MPFGKHTRHKTTRKIGQSGKSETPKELTKDVRKIEKQVKKMVKIETPVLMRFISTVSQNLTGTYTGAGFNIDGYNQFTGSTTWNNVLHGQVRAMGIRFRGNVNLSSNSLLVLNPIQPLTYRIIIVRDKQPNANPLVPLSAGATFADDLFQTAVVGSATSLYSTFVQSKPRRFDVLYDKCFKLQTYYQQTTYTVTPNQDNMYGINNHSIKINLKGRKIQILPNAGSGSFAQTERYLAYFLLPPLSNAPLAIQGQFDYMYTSSG